EISGFSDEIASDFQTQLKTVNELGMSYISLRGINDKNIGDYSVEMIKKDVLPRLKQWDIGVSSIGSPIGKIYINDEDAFQKQLATLKTLCEISQLLNCQYIRIFSFYIPKEDNFDAYKDIVVSKLKHLQESLS